MYQKRTIEATIKQSSNFFPVILLTGPRQVGKTTVLQSIAQERFNYVTLDDLDERALANSDPQLFLQKHSAPLIIDEVQYAPGLFSQIKLVVDKVQKPGMYWLTGSQKFHLMQHITESLAGRIAILDLLGLSQSEIDRSNLPSFPFCPTDDWLSRVEKNPVSKLTINTLYERIWRGSYPKLSLTKDMPRELFYNSYIQTYISRDVRQLTKVGSEITFNRFLRTIAARSGQLINYNQLSNELDLDNKTVKNWISILETSGLIYILQPYHNNLNKRLLKTPKLYFLDTGLCTYLSQWSSPKALEAGAMSGAILETYVVSEVLKSYWHNGKNPNLYFYRDKDKKEIDLLIEQNDCLYPIEIKKTAAPSQSSIKNFNVLEKLNKSIGHGIILCLKQNPIAINKDVTAIPIGFI